MKKKWLFVFSRAPYCGQSSQEMLDQLMTASAFDEDVSLLLIDSGVCQLGSQQQARQAGLKDTSKMFAALALYGIEKPYVESESLEAYGLQEEQLMLPVHRISRDSVADFLNGFDLVVRQ